ncbi:TetR/AcrR family transcriptional regulator [Agrobacterium tumefaciens]|uniref:TetR/AcrR family transcriptional regulator n=1 Tax=Agrobacterium tumefaciens TaxID=358 RepID=UPI000DD2E728|nr:TetR/AcrR family transcriptional regulator [Agrobacterium tumefaciens]MDP9873711.1 AcrR family transcriptional regulator [Agrobacterium tumefaciens]MDP9979242.1 AcrR family transcriptional regulator [Agrobacterium tumefaciens]
MPRHKLISDNQALDALLPLMLQTGPDGLTFAAAAKACGLSAATLVQRYGKREDLVEAVLLRAWDGLQALTEAADAKEPVTPQGAISLLMGLTSTESAEQNASDGLLLLREDIRNPVLRERGARWGRTLAHALGRRVTENGKNAERLGWQMASIWQGAHTWWAFTRAEDAGPAIRKALEEWVAMVERAERLSK